MYRERAHGARLRLSFDDHSDNDGMQTTTPLRNTETGHYMTPPSGAGWNPDQNYWDDLPPSPRKVHTSSRKAPASPRRAVPYSSRKPKGSRTGPLHLAAHDSILGTPLCDSHGPVYPMLCCVMLQACNERKRYVLMVVLYREDSDMEPTLLGRKVAHSSVAKNVRPGSLRVSVSSEALVPDPEYREQLHKTEHDWDGTDVEKQFILRLKPGYTLCNIFGTVTISSMRGLDAGTSCFNLRLVLPTASPSSSSSPSCTASPSSPAEHPEDVSWGAVAFRELALHLRLLDECGDWQCLARDMGFTEHEIVKRLAPAPDPFAALLDTYRDRGGTPDELLTGMYKCSRMRGLQVSPNKGLQSQASAASANSATIGSSAELLQFDDPELDGLEEASALRSHHNSLASHKRPRGLSRVGSGEKPSTLQKSGSGGKPTSLSRSGSGDNPSIKLASVSTKPKTHSVFSRPTSTHSRASQHNKPLRLSKQDSMTRHSIGRSEHEFNEDADEGSDRESGNDDDNYDEDDDECDRETIPVEQLNIDHRRVQDLTVTPPATPLRRLAVSKPVKAARPRDVFVFPSKTD